jgi:hypothetical protein
VYSRQWRNARNGPEMGTGPIVAPRVVVELRANAYAMTAVLPLTVTVILEMVLGVFSSGATALIFAPKTAAYKQAI